MRLRQILGPVVLVVPVHEVPWIILEQPVERNLFDLTGVAWCRRMVCGLTCRSS